MNINNKNYKIFDINAIAQKNGVDISSMPFSIKILLENVARTSTEADVIKVLNWLKHKGKDGEDVQSISLSTLLVFFRQEGDKSFSIKTLKKGTKPMFLNEKLFLLDLFPRIWK
jgi:aconitase A